MLKIIPPPPTKNWRHKNWEIGLVLPLYHPESRATLVKQPSPLHANTAVPLGHCNTVPMHCTTLVKHHLRCIVLPDKTGFTVPLYQYTTLIHCATVPPRNPGQAPTSVAWYYLTTKDHRTMPLYHTNLLYYPGQAPTSVAWYFLTMQNIILNQCTSVPPWSSPTSVALPN